MTRLRQQKFSTFFLFLACFMSPAPGSSPNSSERFKVWTENPMVRIHPDTPTGSKNSIEIAAARNETEPFQIIVTSQGSKLDDVTVTISDLANDRGERISSETFRFFRQEYVYVRNPSPYSPYPPGWWPDALIPFVNPYDGKGIPPMQLVRHGDGEHAKYQLRGARFSASPFTVWPSRNQPVWGEVRVPKEAPAGEYNGKITVKCWACAPQSIPIKLTVWDFELPSTPPLVTYFGSLEGIAEKHGRSPGSQEALLLQSRYASAMEEHWLSAPVPAAYLPQIRSDGSIDWKHSHSMLKRYMDAHRTGSFRIPNFHGSLNNNKFQKKFSHYLRSYYEYLRSQGWEKGAFYYPVEEPNSRESYEQVRVYAQLIHDAEPRVSLLCTEQPYSQDSSWGELLGSVDIWCPLFAFMEEARNSIIIQKGNQLWTYTALCQKAPPYHPEFQKVGGLNTFFWQIDFPSLNFRVPLWVIWKSQVQGLLYWSTVHWNDPERDVWTDPAFRNRYNGEGYFFYPGTEAGIEGPVLSIRLKALREGFEDLAYLTLLTQMGERDFAAKYVAQIANSWWKWDEDAEALYRVRAALAQRIVEKRNNSKSAK